MGKSNGLGPTQPLASQPPQTQAQGRGQGGDTGAGGRHFWLDPTHTQPPQQVSKQPRVQEAGLPVLRMSVHTRRCAPPPGMPAPTPARLHATTHTHTRARLHTLGDTADGSSATASAFILPLQGTWCPVLTLVPHRED